MRRLKRKMGVIETFNLTKEYSGLKAVDNLNLNVDEGEIFGLLGPNGAGKTTTLKMLSTLTKPSSGYATVAGYDIIKERDEVRASIGIVFQDPSLDLELTGKENLEFHARMYGMKKEDREKRINEVLELLSLDKWKNMLVKYYSGGMQRRLEIARGLIHHPKVLFLDEPTLGLDAQTRRLLWNYIKELAKKERITIVLTTHYMDEADYLCDRVGIIDHGKLMITGKPEELKSKVGHEKLMIEIENLHDNASLEKKLSSVKWIGGFKKVEGTVSNSHTVLEIEVDKGDRRIPEVVDIVRDSGVELLSITLKKPSLEDVFIEITGKTIREAEASEKDVSKQDMRIRRRLWSGGKR